MFRGAASRFLVGPALGLLAASAVVGIFAQGCGSKGAVLGICPLDDEKNVTVPRACCPCSLPEDCPDGEPPIPAWCCQDGRKAYSLYGSTCVADDGGTDASADGGAMSAIICPLSDRCLPPALGFIGPEFVYKGVAFGAPTCPVETPEEHFYGVADPSAVPPPPFACPACICDSPEGTCSLPTTWTISSEACPGGGVKTPFDPSADWDGTCLADETIPAGAMCNGKPCVRSITVSAPVLEEKPCTPHRVEVEIKTPAFRAELAAFKAEPSSFKSEVVGWQVALACGPSSSWPACKGEESKLCVPKAGEEFATCVRAPGDVACPEGWPVRSLYFDDGEDERTCSDCTCDAPAGGMCLASISLASDATCSGFPLQGVMVTSAAPTSCHDLPPGVALTSKAASLVAYEPGTCAPIESAVEGKVDVSGPMTLCCLADG